MNIYLREVRADDIERIIAWRNHPSVVNHYIDRTMITQESHKRFYEEKIKTGLYIQYMVEKVEEEFGVCSYTIACVYLKDIDKKNKKCELCMIPSADKEWDDDSKQMALLLLVKKAFTELNMNKVYATVFPESKNEIGLLTSIGFVYEATLESEISIDKKFYDLVRYKYLKYNFIGQ